MNTTGPEMAYREYEDRFAALKQQNADLTAEVERLRRDLCMTEAERDAARADVAEARRVIEPFVNSLPEVYLRVLSISQPNEGVTVRSVVTESQFRAAASFYARSGGGE